MFGFELSKGRYEKDLHINDTDIHHGYKTVRTLQLGVNCNILGGLIRKNAKLNQLVICNNFQCGDAESGTE